MPEIEESLFVKAALGKEITKFPIFIHRQAGRYLPEYRKTKGKKNFFQLCKDPETVCELTLQPIKKFDLDAAIIFSDILVIPQAIGFEVNMVPQIGPLFKEKVTIENFPETNFRIDLRQKLSYVYEAIKLTRSKLKPDLPLIGFTGGPWTLMSYMVEGKSSKNCVSAKKWLFRCPEKAKLLLNRLTSLIVNHLLLQMEAGCQVLEVFETLAGHLGPKEFRNFVLPCLSRIVSELRAEMGNLGMGAVPIVLFPKGANHSLKEVSETGCDVIAIDWTISVNEARKIVGDDVTLMGNLDPAVLYGDEETIKKETKEMLTSLKNKRFIANLGHGMLPDMDFEAVRIFVDEVHSVKIDKF
ncbi:hypothetical protein MHBO_000621 [Bonamia ostreae]|uniref:uroporphyrinogen decarboxylase n=1 Tax=Bonamia ostreae TaxID=126728 RepID=A0ABV2AG81_9EUKA